ncbi:MAG: GatB/YqeY domain-containing protein [Firmicutes bacterium]|nr:GatB/YqeY domain-containing protein [Bacillota bacterium]
MSLKDRLSEDLKSAMRAAPSDVSQKIRVSTIRFLNAEIKNAEITKKSQLTDEEIVEIIQKQIKRRREAVEQYRKGNREDLAEKEESEAKILASYLPKQLTDDEIRELAKRAIKDTGATSIKEMGRVMSKLMPEVRGRADGKRVNEIVSELLKG